MIKPVRSYLQLSLKIANFTIGLMGIAMLIYSIWMIRVTSHHPLIMLSFLGLSMHFLVLALLCEQSLSLVMLLHTLPTPVASHLHQLTMRCRDQDLPEDPSGRFHDFKDFVNSNDEVCQSIALLCFLTQGCGILLAPILRAVGKIKENSHENEDEYAEPTAPLLRPPELPPNSSLYPYVIGEPVNIEPQCLQDCLSSGR
ncbi:putative esterase-like [Capsicum annuum]|nr:putative esterase-like [Capsicum annuum]KAF3657429.1 putative esterase-like [Capsicum annuum]